MLNEAGDKDLAYDAGDGERSLWRDPYDRFTEVKSPWRGEIDY